MRDMKSHRHGKAGLVGAALALATLTACDVTNPGPIQDEFLADTEAQIGLIYGAQRSIATTYGANVLDLSLMAREVFPGGQIGAWGTDVAIHAGHIEPEEDRGAFDNLHEARFIAETAIKRFTQAGASNERMFQAHLWAGWAYRILGEWWCDTVLPDEDPAVTDPPEYIAGTTAPYFERAVKNFTAALQFAANDQQRQAALAGRASAELWLGNWDAALADAAQVSDGFTFVLEQAGTETPLYNYMAEGNSGTFRSYTTEFTWFKDYYEATGDPRTPWTVDPNFSVAVGSLSGFGQVPYKPQTKFTSRDDPFNLASGQEMKLVRAEAILQGAGSGSFQDAMALINEVRTSNVSETDGQPLEPWVASSAAEAWRFLKRERRIELWLEGRSAPDERRWAALGTPGSLDMPTWEDPSHPGHTNLFLQYERAPLCYDIPASERDRNPNVPQVGG